VNITVDAKVLQRALAVVASVCPSKTPMPIYQKVLFRTGYNNALELIATDTEMATTKAIKVTSCREQGECLLNPSKLAEVLREVDGDVDISVAKGAIEVVAARSDYEFPIEDTAGFSVPEMHIGEKPLMMLDAAKMEKAIEMVLFAASREEGRYSMKGLRIEQDDECLSFVATDAKRLATCRMKSEGDSFELLIPVKAAEVLSRYAKDEANVVSMYMSGQAATFVGDGWKLWSRQVEGRFPDWRGIIPKKAEIKVKVDAVELLRDVKQAAVMIDNESLRMRMVFDGNTVTLEAQGPTVGKSKVVHTLKEAPASKMELFVNPHYLIGFLKEVQSNDNLELWLTGPSKPMVFHYANGVHLIVPMV